MLEAIFLGVLQGLTEFLPISSSAHIRIVGEFLDGAKDPGARFTAITQIGTELAVLIYFRKDILRIIPLSGLAVLAATPVLSYATLLTFDLRLRAATGTGIPSAIWAFPSEIFGFVDVFSQETVTRSFETTAVGIFLSLAILWQLVKKLREKSMASDIAVMGITGFLTIAIGFVLSYTGKQQTNYIFF